MIVRARLRRGNVISHAGAPRLIAQAVTTARAAGAGGQVMVRADSAYYVRDVLATAARHGAWFSVTARMNPAVVKAIAAIDEAAWTSIHYPKAVFDEQAGGWVSDAQVAEVDFTAFTSLPKNKQVTCRLVVRRVRRQQPRASDGSVQGELFADWRHHAFVTNSTLTTSRPTPGTATTQSSSRSSPSSRTAPWPTYPPATTPPTPPGSPSRCWRSTSPAPPRSPPG